MRIFIEICPKIRSYNEKQIGLFTKIKFVKTLHQKTNNMHMQNQGRKSAV